MELKAFKIKNKDGKFSTGGCNPNWTSRGKTWGSFASLKSHLRQKCSHYQAGTSKETGEYRFRKGWWNNIPEDWIVVELSAEGVKEYSAKELYPLTTGEKI